MAIRFAETIEAPKAKTERKRKYGTRFIGKKLQKVNDEFKALPKEARSGKTGVAVYRALGRLGGIPDKTMDAHASQLLAFLEATT